MSVDFDIPRSETGHLYWIYHTHPDGPAGNMYIASGYRFGDPDNFGDFSALSALATKQRALGYPGQTTSIIIPEKGYPFAFTTTNPFDPWSKQLPLPIAPWEP